MNLPPETREESASDLEDYKHADLNQNLDPSRFTSIPRDTKTRLTFIRLVLQRRTSSTSAPAGFCLSRSICSTTIAR